MSLKGFFERRVRGVRVVELWAGGLTLVLALGVYLAKTGAGDEGADIARTQVEINREQREIRLLKAEVAYLEQPQRLERLSSAFLGLQPMSGKRETVVENLQEVARAGPIAPAAATPQPATVAAPAAAAPADDPETPTDDEAPQ